MGATAADGPICTDPTVMAWLDGEREQWRARAVALDHGREQPGWGKAVAAADKLRDLTPQQVSWLVTTGPEAPARALLAEPARLWHRQRIDVARVAVARFELDAFELALHEAGESADQLGVLMLPFRGPRAATLVAGWLRHLGSARLWARLWLNRHAEAAARALIPAAAGRPGRPRQNAGDALRYLAANGHAPIVLKNADSYGQTVLAAIEALLSLPAGAPRKAKAPEWTRPDRLPEIRAAGGGPVHVERLIEGLSRTTLEAPPEPAPGDPALPLVVESAAAAQPMVQAPDPETARLIAGCDRQSLAVFGRALLDEWLTDGMPASEAWVVLAQAHVGDDTTMDVLAPLVRSWPARSRWARAIDGLAVLATAGTDVALRHLLAIETGMSGGPTNERAVVYLTQAAAARGLSVAELADRLVGTHGLDAGITLDYGPRQFTVVTDDHLVPHLAGADGRVLARPPKPGARDTRPEAYQQFLQLKKDLRAAAAGQIARLEKDMLTRRLRPARHIGAVLLPHPILGPLARRLLWGEFDTRNRLVRALRIAEDGSFADVHDGTAVVADETPIGIVHPADLGPELGAWAQTFADYEILQPFPQVLRPAVVLTAEERAATSLPGFGPVPGDGLVALLRGGWEGDGHVYPRVHRQLGHDLPGGLTLLIELDPGVPDDGYQRAGEQQITEMWVDDSRSDHWQRARHIPFGACDPAALSEALVKVRAL